MTTTRVLTTHVPTLLADKVYLMANRLDRSRGWVVKQAIAAWVDLEEQRHQMTLEALGEVDAGLLVDHAQVQGWARSLTSEVSVKPSIA